MQTFQKRRERRGELQARDKNTVKPPQLLLEEEMKIPKRRKRSEKEKINEKKREKRWAEGLKGKSANK